MRNKVFDEDEWNNKPNMDKQLKEVTVSGGTYEEALEAGLQVLGLGADMVDVTHIDHADEELLPNCEPLEGVTLTLRPRTQDIAQSARTHLAKVLELMGIKAHIEKINRPRGTVLNILAGDDGSLIIGKMGQNLEALQYIINRMATQSGLRADTQPIMIDSENYYEKHLMRMEDLAHRAARRIQREDRVTEVALPAMSAADRRLIHTMLRDTRDVHTISRGEGLTRHVVVTADRMQVVGSPLGEKKFQKISMSMDNTPAAVAPPAQAEKPAQPRRERNDRERNERGERGGRHRRRPGRRRNDDRGERRDNGGGSAE